MSEYIFRVVRVSDQQEIYKSVQMVRSCFVWAENPEELRVEMVDLLSTAENRAISPADCCARMRTWFRGQMDILSDAKRKRITELIQGACRRDQE